MAFLADRIGTGQVFFQRTSVSSVDIIPQTYTLMNSSITDAV